MIGIIANLATAWFFIAFVTRYIHNSLLRAIIRYGAWIWVTLSSANLTDETQEQLENIAFKLGTMRLSFWAVV
ncbi:MscS Mechanosensitive ion channel [Rhodobacteraceae bacterium HTCC2083]|nr:MscS Mechanosensitive ion channel [Rhodobacteraceae bacterium HTCC2083]